MRYTPRVRFVGGSVHNQLLTVELRTEIRIPAYTEALLVFAPYEAHPEWKEDVYRLFKFFTGLGALYYQYVHESLIRGGDPVPETYLDADLPTGFEIDVSKLYAAAS